MAELGAAPHRKSQSLYGSGLVDHNSNEQKNVAKLMMPHVERTPQGDTLRCEGHAELLLFRPISAAEYVEEVSDSEHPAVFIPDDAQITHLQGFERSFLLLPLLCVADSDNIIALVTSSLYQRHALGIVEPVVGISISTHDSIARVLFGWLSEGEQDGLVSTELKLLRDFHLQLNPRQAACVHSTLR